MCVRVCRSIYNLSNNELSSLSYRQHTHKHTVTPHLSSLARKQDEKWTFIIIIIFFCRTQVVLNLHYVLENSLLTIYSQMCDQLTGCLCIENDVLGRTAPKGTSYFDMYDILYCLRIEFLDIYMPVYLARILLLPNILSFVSCGLRPNTITQLLNICAVSDGLTV